MESIKYRYATYQGKLVCIEDVDFHDEFKCVACGQIMIARLGKTRMHHFAHKKETNCEPESYLHKLASLVLKQKFESGKFEIELYQEKLCDKSGACPFEENCNEKILQRFDLKEIYTTCEERKKADKFISDLLISGNEHKPILIEVFVTHKCTFEKENSNLRIVEIPVQSESDIEYLKNNPLSENKGIRFYNFKRTIKEKHKLNNKPLARISIFDDGTALATILPCQRQNDKYCHQSIAELNIDYNGEKCDEYEDYSDVLKNELLKVGISYAIRNGIFIKDCNICTHIRQEYLTGKIFCFKNSKTKYDRHFDTSKAVSCFYYQKSNVMSRINVKKITAVRKQ